VFRSLVKVPIHPTLLDIIESLDLAYPGMVTITEGYRIDDKGCHGTEPLRALDLRSWVFQDPALIESDINNNWEYDSKRPDKRVCVFHKTKHGAFHFHVQIHPNTRRL